MASAARRSGNLPAEASSFVGRRRELAELRSRLAGARVVSLVGPGGVGKTRLAVRGATDLARGFGDGAWLVELAEVRDAQGVLRAALGALGLQDHGAARGLDLVADHVRDKNLLLVVDNCEHVLRPAAELVDVVLAAGRDVRVVATSREPLSVAGEHLLPVPPLDLPAAGDAQPLARLAENEAVRLFSERAAAASGRFELTDVNRSAVVGICRRLDGLPLALELAAVKARVLAVEEILTRLDDRFGLLAPGGRVALPRHQTLETAIDWSHDLLAPQERTLLRRLSVFAGHFTLDDATGVCASEDLPARAVLGLLSSLVDKSMVTTDAAGPVARHRLHESMRAYAAERLAEAGDGPATASRFIDHYLAACLTAAEDARTRLVAWLAWVDLEIENIRLAIDLCRERGEGDHALALAGALPWYWVTRAQAEGIDLLDGLLAAYPGDTAAHAGAHFMRGFLAILQSDPATGRRELDRAVDTARTAATPQLLVEALAMGSVAAAMTADRVAAGALLDEAADLAGGVDDAVVRAAVLQARAMACFFAEDLAGFRAASTEGVRLSRDLGDLYTLEICLMNLGFAALATGDADPRPPLSEALEIARRIDDRVAQFYLVAALGCRAAGRQELRHAARLLGAGDALRMQTGAGVNALLAPVLAHATAAVRAGLGPDRYEVERSAGACLDREAAATLALGADVPEAGAPGRGTRSGPLSNREAEVARLVGDGLTNRQIGSRLFISERTVETHVRSIMNRLGFSSRAQIAGWVSDEHV